MEEEELKKGRRAAFKIKMRGERGETGGCARDKFGARGESKNETRADRYSCMLTCEAGGKSRGILRLDMSWTTLSVRRWCPSRGYTVYGTSFLYKRSHILPESFSYHFYFRSIQSYNFPLFFLFFYHLAPTPNHSKIVHSSPNPASKTVAQPAV